MAHLKAVNHDLLRGEKIKEVKFGSSLPEGLRPTNTYSATVLHMESGKVFVMSQCWGEVICSILYP